MPKIIVSALSVVSEVIDEHDVGRVLGLLGPDMDHPDLSHFDGLVHKPITMHDISSPIPGMMPPGEEHVDDIIEFIGDWDKQKPFLIHCFAGISRSTASCFIAMCMLKPEIDELDLAFKLRQLSPTATPNRLIVNYADQRLGRQGRMLDAVHAIGRGEDYREDISWHWELEG